MRKIRLIRGGAMSDYPGAISYLVDPSRVFIDQNSHSTIVLHCTAGTTSQTVEQLGDYFRTTSLMTSSHYGVGRDGRIAQYVLEKDGSAANCCLETGYDPFWNQFPGNKNLHTLSIECVNDATNSQPLTPAQMAALFPLVAYLVKKYNIPLANIKGHFSLEPIDRADCPGPQFPWTQLKSYLQGGTMATPIGWSDNGTTLFGPNGVPITLGFRSYVLSHPWDPGNVPLQSVEARTPILLSNPALGGGTRQKFRDCELFWTSATNVQPAPIGQELAAVEKALATVVTPATISTAIAQASTTLTQLQQHANQVVSDITSAQAILAQLKP